MSGKRPHLTVASEQSAEAKPKGAAPKAEPASRLWAVGGGKGGVGKSLLTANLGVTLAQMGKRVCVIDADLGGANLHSCLGVSEPAVSLDDFVRRDSEDLNELVLPTQIPNLSLISGAGDVVGAANPKHQQKVRLIRKIRELDFDHVILDLGAGTAYNTLDFFLTAQQGVLMCLPEPTSIENLYRFVKAAFYRRLRDLDTHFKVKELVQAAMTGATRREIKSPHDLFEQITQIDPERGASLQAAMQRFRPKLVVNQVRGGADAAVGQQVGLAVRKYFGIDLQYIGYLEYDDTVWKAIRKRRPVLLEYPSSRMAGAFRSIASRLLTS